MDNMDEQQLEDFIRAVIMKFLNESQDNDVTIIDEEVDIVSGYFDIGAAMVAAVEAEIVEAEWIMSVSTAYRCLGVLIDSAIRHSALDDVEDWRTVENHFHQRAAEFVGFGEHDSIIEVIPTPRQIFDITDRVVRTYDNHTERYGNEFDTEKKIQFIRATLLGLRNAGFIKYDGWFKTLIAMLQEDWRIYGGGFPTTPPPSGDTPWSQPTIGR